MNTWIARIFLFHLLAAQTLWFAGLEAAEEPLDYQKEISPIFARHCVKCHGVEKQESSLRVDQKASLLRGGDWSEPSIVPGRPEASFLYRVVAGLESDLKMPPTGERLTADEIARIKKWIEQGAPFPESVDSSAVVLQTDHWSFQPIIRAAIPQVGVESAIDAFLLEKLGQQDLAFAAMADRRTLIRRLYLVMLGLLPKPEVVEAFVQDQRPDAWERLVSEVLESPHYGERWGRHWLDLIRFGETHGFETNRERPHAWRYRDWVIQAFNEDKPYNVFVEQQLAGDILGEPIGTGFLVAGPHDLVKSPDINLTLMQRQDELSDLINATGTAFLGLTLGCARCHNHKFDPVTQRDFYAIQAVFAGVQHADRDLPLPEDRSRQISNLDQQLAALSKRLEPFLVSAASSGERVAVSPALNQENFPAVATRFVRFQVNQTTGGQPCLDELEVYSGETNVALKSHGSRATSSSNLPGYEIHKLDHIHDGRFGNSHSWISNEPGRGWVQIEFAEAQEIQKITWARDREGHYQDRLVTEYEISVSLDGSDWQVIASHRDRIPYKSNPRQEPRYQFEGVPDPMAKQARAWEAELNSLNKQREQLLIPLKVYAGTFQQPGPTHRLYRGDPLAPREVVPPDAIAILGTLELEENAPEQQRRLAFARFLTAPTNPLTARVIVNRLWQFHFGVGIVATPSDFGANGGRPSHPELLDWLASELIENNWSLKHIHRRLLLSKAWQQASTPRSDGLAIDASSQLLWRFPPRRLEAEAIRDCMLSASGVLDPTMGGPGFSGFEVDLENVRHFHPKSTYGPEDWRRMIYMTKVRQEQDSVFGLFDCPDASQVVPQRSRSTTPLQALNLMNSTFVLQQSELLAKRLEHAAPNEVDRQIQLAFENCFNRPATDRELRAATAFIAAEGLKPFCRALFNTNEFLFIP